MLGSLDQPIADPAFIPLRALSTFARREVTVAIGGEGADELFGGYPRYRWLARSARISAAVPTRVPALMAKSLSSLPRLRASLSSRRRVGAGLHLRTAPGLGDRQPRLGSARPLRAADGSGARVEREGSRAFRPRPPAWRRGRGSDAPRPSSVASRRRPRQSRPCEHGCLTRAPHALSDPGTRRVRRLVPSSVNLRDGGKLLLRKVLERKLPAFGLGRSKMAFRTPYSEWLRGPLRPTLEGQLAESPLYRDGWFEQDTVRGGSTGISRVAPTAAPDSVLYSFSGPGSERTAPSSPSFVRVFRLMQTPVHAELRA